MSGELAPDAGLTVQEEIKRVMKSALDAIIHGLDSRFQQLTARSPRGIWVSAAWMLRTSLMSYDDNNSGVEVKFRSTELLQMRIQTTSTGIVSWTRTRYKTAEYSSVDVQQSS